MLNFELIEQLLGHIIRTEQTAGETALVAPSSTATPKVVRSLARALDRC